MMPASKQQNHARRHVGLVLALVGLISAASLATGPIRESSAQADAQSLSYTGSLTLHALVTVLRYCLVGRCLLSGATSGAAQAKSCL
jgi:hypothetical protein